MKPALKLLFISLFFLGSYSYGQTEDTTKVIHRIEKHDGVIYVGEILSDDGREVLVMTQELGKIYIPKSEIKSMKIIEDYEVKSLTGNFREVGPFTTRYYFTNNALPIEKGEDYAMVHLYGPEAHFAVGDNFSLGVMSTWIASPIGVAAKYSIPTKNEKINLAIGTIMFSSGYLWNAQGWGGLHWMNITYGKPGQNINFSAGYGYVDAPWSRRHDLESGIDRLQGGPVLSIGGIAPVGKRASFIFDSMIIISEQRNYQTVYPNAVGYDNQPPFTIYNSGIKTTAVLMPGMRFQKSDDRCFQVALSGVIEHSTVGFWSSSDTPTTRAFPVPMCSWLFKF